jgi:hypothetical protein
MIREHAGDIIRLLRHCPAAFLSYGRWAQAGLTAVVGARRLRYDPLIISFREPFDEPG